MKRIPFISLVFAALLLSCSDNKLEDKETVTNIKPTDSSADEDFDGPPFADTCLCDFREFGDYKISNENYNIYLRGKGWNPEYYSCSWVWGEDIANIFPDDTNIVILKIHLLNLERFEIPSNSTEFGNDTIQKYVIATYTADKRAGKDYCEFDPYKTGKYPKPLQWVED